MATTALQPITDAAIQAQQFSYALFDSWAAWIADRAEITQKSYSVCIKCFLEWLQENGIQQPQRADITAYKEWLAQPHQRRHKDGGKGEIITFSAGTQARYMRAVKMFFRWAESNNLYKNVSADVRGAKVRMDVQKRDAFQREDITRILDSIDRTTEAGKRDYAIILLSVTAGLRIIEMQRADIGDIETVAGERVLFVQGKGHAEKDAYKKLPAEVYTAITSYLTARGTTDKAAPLFAGTGNRAPGKRLAEPSISRLIKETFKAAGYDTHRLTAHSLRHSSVTFLLEAGATIQEAQQHARHADISTTTIYAHNLDQRKAHTEKRVYDFIFNKQATTPADQARAYIDQMPADKQAKALELLAALAG